MEDLPFGNPLGNISIQLPQQLEDMWVGGVELPARRLHAALAPPLVRPARRQHTQSGALAPLPTGASVRGCIDLQHHAHAARPRVLQQGNDVRGVVCLGRGVGAESVNKVINFKKNISRVVTARSQSN